MWWLIAVGVVAALTVLQVWAYFVRRHIRRALDEGVILDWNRAEWRRQARFGKVWAIWTVAFFAVVCVGLIVLTVIEAS